MDKAAEAGIEQSKATGVCPACGAEFPAEASRCPNDGHELLRKRIDPLIGVLLPRNYRVIRQIGVGAMSVVYEGLYEPMQTRVAIKLLKSHLVSDQQAYKRFQQEAKTAGSLEHPNIVGILDFGITEQSVPYLIMELLQGKSLSQVIEAEKRLPIERAVRMFMQCADALAYTHMQNVVHRDIKPSNIIVLQGDDGQDVVKVVDFGIAKLQSYDGNPSLHLTKTGEVFGTPLYVSPEQAMGKTLDGRSDIYSLGCVMFEALTGQPVFRGDTAFDIIRSQVMDEAATIDQVAPDLKFPPQLTAVVKKTLSKDRENRYQSMEELYADLGKVLTGDSQSQTSVMPVVRQAPGGSLSPMILRMIALGCLLLFGCGVMFVNHMMSQKHSGSKGLATTLLQQSATTHGISTEALHDQAQKLYHDEQYEDAEKLFHEIVDIQRAHGKDKVALADALSDLSMVKIELQQDDEAEKLAEEALQIRKTLPAPHNSDAAISLQALAGVACNRGDYPKAEMLLNQALALRERVLGPMHQDVAETLQNLAKVDTKLGRGDEALKLLKRSLAIREAKFGKNDFRVAETLVSLGTVYFNIGQPSHAETAFKRAIQIDTKQFGADSYEVSKALTCLAMLHEDQRRYPLAVSEFKQVAAISEKVWGADSERLVKPYQRVANALRKAGKASEASAFDVRAQRLATGSR